jgi:hypothetical protein
LGRVPARSLDRRRWPGKGFDGANRRRGTRVCQLYRDWLRSLDLNLLIEARPRPLPACWGVSTIATCGHQSPARQLSEGGRRQLRKADNRAPAVILAWPLPRRSRSVQCQAELSGTAPSFLSARGISFRCGPLLIDGQRSSRVASIASACLDGSTPPDSSRSRNHLVFM